jgi:hypothetical protein
MRNMKPGTVHLGCSCTVADGGAGPLSMLHAWQSHGQRRGSDASWSTLAGMPVTVPRRRVAPAARCGPGPSLLCALFSLPVAAAWPGYQDRRTVVHSSIEARAQGLTRRLGAWMRKLRRPGARGRRPAGGLWQRQGPGPPWPTGRNSHFEQCDCAMGLRLWAADSWVVTLAS